MPTGYTYPVAEGTITEFKDFALQCARAFGACVTMRDDVSGVPIPEQFEPSSYHVNELKTVRERLAWLDNLSVEEVKQEAARAQTTARHAEEDYVRAIREQNDRINAMLRKVQVWTPPSNSHTGLKTFMLEQLQMSLQGPSPNRIKTQAPVAWKDWLDKEIEKAQESILYHTEEHAKELERTNQRNEWLRKLRESL